VNSSSRPARRADRRAPGRTGRMRACAGLGPAVPSGKASDIDERVLGDRVLPAPDDALVSEQGCDRHSPSSVAVLSAAGADDGIGKSVRVIRFGELEHRADSGAAGREHLQVHFGLAPVVPVVMGTPAGMNTGSRRRPCVCPFPSLIVTSPSVTKYSWSTGWCGSGARACRAVRQWRSGGRSRRCKGSCPCTPFRRVFPAESKSIGLTCCISPSPFLRYILVSQCDTKASLPNGRRSRRTSDCQVSVRVAGNSRPLRDVRGSVSSGSCDVNRFSAPASAPPGSAATPRTPSGLRHTFAHVTHLDSPTSALTDARSAG